MGASYTELNLDIHAFANSFISQLFNCVPLLEYTIFGIPCRANNDFRIAMTVKLLVSFN